MKTLGFVMMVLMVSCTLQGNLKILDTPDGETHPEPCVLVCSGISRHDDDYSWSNPGFGLKTAYKAVDMSKCNFVSEPVVVATTRDVFDTNKYACPSFITENDGKDRFYVISKQNITPYNANKWQCDIHWVATGYSC